MSPLVRERLSELIARHLRPKSLSLQTSSSDIAKRIAQTRDSGISHFGQLLTKDQAAELQRYFECKQVKDPYRTDSPTFLPDGSQRHPDSHVAHHDAKDVIQAPYLLAIANRPDILAIVEGILGCKPTLSYIAAWWSYHTNVGAQQAEHFHRDVDDWRFVKLFIYLTDVAELNGPHVYVLNSSASHKLRKIRRYSDDEVIQHFGKNNIIEITGNAGQGFLEDTFGIHKGQPVNNGRRLIFQAVYSMFPLPYAPKAPVISTNELTCSKELIPDPWINRLYIKS